MSENRGSEKAPFLSPGGYPKNRDPKRKEEQTASKQRKQHETEIIENKKYFGLQGTNGQANCDIQVRKPKQQANNDNIEKKTMSEFLEKTAWHTRIEAKTLHNKKRKDNQQQKVKTNRQERKKKKRKRGVLNSPGSGSSWLSANRITFGRASAAPPP